MFRSGGKREVKSRSLVVSMWSLLGLSRFELHSLEHALQVNWSRPQIRRRGIAASRQIESITNSRNETIRLGLNVTEICANLPGLPDIRRPGKARRTPGLFHLSDGIPLVEQHSFDAYCNWRCLPCCQLPSVFSPLEELHNFPSNELGRLNHTGKL